MMIKEFGIVDGRMVHLYTIENENIKLQCCEFGARIVSLIIKPLNIDVVLGFDAVDGYIQNSYIGATIGRVCNRISNAQFSLNNQIYQLAQNNAVNCLHGGDVGFDKQIFKAEIEVNQISFSYLSPDMDQGFPGNLKLDVTYKLLDDGIDYSYQATSDKDTLCSITNHAFFNINGDDSDNALNVKLKINAHQVSMLDKNGCTLEETFEVGNTPFDFTSAAVIENNIKENHPQLVLGNGFDHNYSFEDASFKDIVELTNDKLTMIVSSDMPCMHFYSGNFLDGSDIGKKQHHYPRRSGICFETQYYPSAINYPTKIAPILKVHNIQKHSTTFRFTWEEK